jgi:hypothetical protein
VLVVEEAFASGDSHFLEYVDLLEGQAAARVVERWKRDHRPWAREQFLKYLEQARAHGANGRLVIKRFFKHADASGDDELMGVFMWFFDRQVRRVRRSRRFWDATARSVREGPEVLRATGGGVFRAHTSYYCRRGAWRYFRRMGFKRPGDYPRAVAAALARYGDGDSTDGDAILDSWGLMHACFGEGDAVEFNSTHARLARAAGLDEMIAPYFAELWRKPESARVLLELVLAARSRVVRGWAMQILRRDHRERLREVSADDLLRLLDHDDEDAQRFGAELLEGASAAGRFDVATWLRLLRTRSLTALGVIVEAMKKHVRAADLNVAQRVELARAEPVPVARLGLEFLRGATFDNDADRRELARLAGAQAEGVGRELAAFALSVLGAPGVYDLDLVARFFDSLNPGIRQGAWDWLVEGSAGWGDAGLWSRLVETPYEDVRLRFVAALEARERKAAPGWEIGVEALGAVWCSVLLGIHRGGRAKLAALRQISEALGARPEHAETLLPVVAVAIRSVRFPEARAGLAAVVGAMAVRPEIEPLVRRHLPELSVEAMPAQGVAP